jgi:hypothetical protein
VAPLPYYKVLRISMLAAIFPVQSREPVGLTGKALYSKNLAYGLELIRPKLTFQLCSTVQSEGCQFQ